MIDNQDDDGVCTMFLLKGVTFGVDGFVVLSWCVLDSLLQEIDRCSGTIFLCNSSFFFSCVYLYCH
jgi:hypothetical protein